MNIDQIMNSQQFDLAIIYISFFLIVILWLSIKYNNFKFKFTRKLGNSMLCLGLFLYIVEKISMYSDTLEIFSILIHQDLIINTFILGMLFVFAPNTIYKILKKRS